MRSRLTLVIAAAVALSACDASAKGRAKPVAGDATFARHIELAVRLDAQSTAIVAQRRAAAARHATADSPSPGSPYVAGSVRQPGRGSYSNLADPFEPRTNRTREAELEIGMPLWLPGQRDALRETIFASVAELGEKTSLRRLDIAGRIREAWWTVRRAAREAGLARERLATAKDIERDIRGKAGYGDVAHPDVLLAANETFAAQSELIQAEAAEQAARAAYRTLVGADPPAALLERTTSSTEIGGHPVTRVARAALERAQAQSALVDATFIDNPEVGVFGRRETTAQGLTRSEATTVGVRFRIALPTAGRNEPRKAEATAEIIRAQSELTQAQRLVSADAAVAAAALSAARALDASAARRLANAEEQYQLAFKSLQFGEIGAFELFRIRQILIEARRFRATAEVDVGLAHARLNQARGWMPK